MDVCLCDGTVGQLVSSLVPEVSRSYTAGPSERRLVICAVGPSGTKLAQDLALGLEQEADVSIVRATIDVAEKGERIAPLTWDPKGERVLLCDSIVNTGSTMLKARGALLAGGAREVRTVSLVVRRGAALIPNYYCLEVERQDSVFFGTTEYPVRGTGEAVLRRADARDRDQALNLAEEYVTATIAEYEYDRASDAGYQTFIVEAPDGRIAGLLHFRHGQDNSVFVDTIAICTPFRRRGYAGSVLRFIQDYCRFAKVTKCTMYSVSDRVDMYLKVGYRRTGRRLELPYGVFEEIEATFL